MGQNYTCISSPPDNTRNQLNVKTTELSPMKAQSSHLSFLTCSPTASPQTLFAFTINNNITIETTVILIRMRSISGEDMLFLSNTEGFIEP